MSDYRDNNPMPAPRNYTIKRIQAKRLSKLINVPESELVKAKLSIIKNKFRIDPKLFFFQRICGQVVKVDPATLEEKPVPFATVHVQDTDCHLLGFAPGGWPWMWFFPLWCDREEIGKVVTDACGRFCVNVPRWDIDWILKWRHIHICYPIIFRRPNIRDILEHERFKRFKKPIVRWPFPWPPPELEFINQGGIPLKQAQEYLSSPMVHKLISRTSAPTQTQHIDDLMQMPAFSQQISPPLPVNIRQIAKKKEKLEFGRQFDLDDKLSLRFNPHHYIGPFLRCIDLILPEWQSFIDVPDITFKVTQDVDSDGNEEVIYTESFFDVRWDETNIPDVKLVADQIALAGVTCDEIDVPCAEPAIVLAGKTPLHNPPLPEKPYVDTALGYALRTNRPHPSSSPSEAVLGETALSPFCGTFPFYGCNHSPGALYYRLAYQYKAPGSGTFLPDVIPFTGFTWPLYRWVGSPGHLEKLIVAPDSNGWYSILNDADGWMPSKLLLLWPSGSFQNGTYKVIMQFANPAKVLLPALTTAPVTLRVDNSYPGGGTSFFSALDWREVGGAWHHLEGEDLICPVMARTVGKDLEFRISYQASHPHFRSLYLSAVGCGGGSMLITSAPTTIYKWHTTPAQTSVTDTAEFKLPHTALQGGYSFWLRVDSRAFNPDDNNVFGADGYADPLYIYAHFSLQIAVVDN